MNQAKMAAMAAVSVAVFITILLFKAPSPSWKDYLASYIEDAPDSPTGAKIRALLKEGNINALLREGDTAFTKRQFQDSIYYYSAVLKLDPDNEVAALGLTNNVRDMEPDNKVNLQNAMGSYQALKEYRSIRNLAKLGITEIYFYNGEPKKALPFAQEIIQSEIDPQILSNARVVLGRVALSDDDYSLAEKEFQAAIKLNDSNHNAYLGYGVVKYKLDDTEGAKELFIRAITMVFNEEDPTARLETILQKLRQDGAVSTI